MQEPYIPSTYRHQPAPLNPWFVRVPLLLISGAILTLAGLAALVAAFQFAFQDRIVPGLWIYTVNAGGMTRDQAAAALAPRLNYADEAVFTFRYGDRFWQMSAGELGVAFDIPATVDEAIAAGHGRDLVGDLAAQASIWLNGRRMAPIVRYDQGVTLTRLREIAEDINQDAVDATLTIQDGVIQATPSQEGRRLDLAATLARLEAVILQMDTGGEVQLVVDVLPPRLRDAETAAARARVALSGPVTLVADDLAGGTLGPWTASAEQIRALLTVSYVTNADGSTSYAVDVNVEPFRAYLETLAPGLISFPQDARFHFDPAAAQLTVIRGGVSGRSLNVDGTLARLKEAIFNPTNRIALIEFDYTLPTYHDRLTAAELGITQLVGESVTYYTGSTRSRIENIIQAASRFDGLVIGPGEEFSFNHWLGDISPETGFVQGKIIFGGRTIEGVGGGVCQVSTTVFRAALLAGFPIIERNSHGYRVGFYELNGSPPGLDAAIFQPTADFRFLNDTPYHLLIETAVFPDQQAVQFRLYSTNPGRQVRLEGPVIRNVTPALNTLYEPNAELQPGVEVQVDWSKEGADVVFERVFLDAAGNETNREMIYTHYQPWAAVIQVAPGDPRLG